MRPWLCFRTTRQWTGERRLRVKVTILGSRVLLSTYTLHLSLLASIVLISRASIGERSCCGVIRWTGRTTPCPTLQNVDSQIQQGHISAMFLRLPAPRLSANRSREESKLRLVISTFRRGRCTGRSTTRVSEAQCEAQMHRVTISHTEQRGARTNGDEVVTIIESREALGLPTKEVVGL